MDIKNNNGIVDKFRFSTLQDYIEKILQIKTKYDLPSITFNIDYNTDIEFDDENGVCYILINKSKIVKYTYHHVFNNIKVAVTAGALNNAVYFVTENKYYRNKKTIKDLESKLKNYIPVLKNELSLIKENGIFYDIYCQLTEIESVRKKYDVKPSKDDQFIIKVNDRICLIYTQLKIVKVLKKDVMTKGFYWAICVNDNPLLKYNGYSINPVTKNEDVNSKEYVDKISKAITVAMPEIEKYFSNKSKEKYGLE